MTLPHFPSGELPIFLLGLDSGRLNTAPFVTSRRLEVCGTDVDTHDRPPHDCGRRDSPLALGRTGIMPECPISTLQVPHLAYRSNAWAKGDALK